MLGIIYRDYLCNNQKRTELLQQEQNKLIKYEEKNRKLYNFDNMFKKENNQIVSSDVILVKHQESIFTKFKKFIFKILHINQ